MNLSGRFNADKKIGREFWREITQTHIFCLRQAVVIICHLFYENPEKLDWKIRRWSNTVNHVVDTI